MSPQTGAVGIAIGSTATLLPGKQLVAMSALRLNLAWPLFLPLRLLATCFSFSNLLSSPDLSPFPFPLSLGELSLGPQLYTVFPPEPPLSLYYSHSLSAVKTKVLARHGAARLSS